MKIINSTILLLLLFAIRSEAQFIQNLPDLQGKPLTENTYTDVSGTPFLLNDWVKGVVEQSNKISYKNVDLKYNTYKDELYFKNPKDGAMLSFSVPVTAFSLEFNGKIESFRNAYPAVDNFTSKTYYQVLFDGEIKLLFKSFKTLIEVKPYNSATTEKKFIDNSSYYVLKENVMKKFKPSKKDILEIFKSKSAELDTFIKNEKIDFKQNQDLIKVFEYYSSL